MKQEFGKTQQNTFYDYDPRNEIKAMSPASAPTFLSSERPDGLEPLAQNIREEGHREISQGLQRQPTK